MRITNNEVIGLLNTLGSVADKDIPVSFTYQLFDIQQKLQDAYQIYWNTLSNIMKKHDVTDPNDPKIIGEVKELLDMMTEVELVKLKRDELIESDINLTLQQLNNLSPIIEG